VSPHILISESVTYCTNQEGVEVSPRAMPYLEQWLRENGYVKRDQRLRDQLAHTTAPVVPDTGDETA
jgi:hypothetical protein